MAKPTKENIVTWLKPRPLINISGLERAAGVPHGSIANAIKGNTDRLSEKHLPEIVKVLKDYGYK
jgi:hypothetical protein